MFEKLEQINQRPKPFEFYTAADLWTDEHISKKMLECHLNPDIDLASYNKDFLDRAVKWIVTHFSLDKKSSVADFGCGPGLYANQIAKSVAKVTGIDFSKRSIEYAQMVADKEKSKVQYVNQNYLEYESSEKFDLIMLIFCDFCVLSPAQRKTLLDKFCSMLLPGGSILLDVFSLNRFAQQVEATTYEKNLMNGFWSPQKYYGFLNTFKYDKEKVVLDKYTIIEKDRTRVIYNWLQHFDFNTLSQEFKNSGLKLVERYSSVAGKAFDAESDNITVVGQKI